MSIVMSVHEPLNESDVVPASPNVPEVYPGLIIDVNVFVDHYAIVSDRLIDGKPALISLSQRCGTVKEESWEEVVGGRPWRVHGYPGDLSGPEVIRRARRAILDQRGYALWSSNCQHFAYEMHGQVPQSPELKTVAGLGAVSWAVALLGGADGRKAAKIAFGVVGSYYLMKGSVKKYTTKVPRLVMSPRRDCSANSRECAEKIST